MENTILIMLIVIALLICAIAGLIIKISGLTQRIKTMEATNRTIYNDLKNALARERELIDTNADLISDNIDLKTKLRGLEKLQDRKYTTADYKKQIIKDYRAGADVHDIATKYCLKANTVFKAIQR